MRILHTSDWHLGKQLELYSRLPEQEEFIEELSMIVEKYMVDLILIAGDIYDTSNPSAEAENLFYRSLIKISNEGKRPIVIISGNHDSPERLAAPIPLAAKTGALIISSQQTIAPNIICPGFSVVDSDCGVVEISIGNENVIILAVPYPSEKRLNEIFAKQHDESELQKTYSEKVSTIFSDLSKKFRADTINLAMGHFYLFGGEYSGSEREIQLAGSYTINPSALPENAQYVALGHLHRPQRAAGTKFAYYSGSPIQYHKNETGYAKCVFLIDVKSNSEPKIEKIYLRNYKPIEIWRTNSAAEAISKCEKHSNDNTWVYLEIKTDKPLTPSEIKQMKSTKKDIVEILPVLEFMQDESITNEEGKEYEKSLIEEFNDFYQELRGTVPSDDLLSLFLSFQNEVSDA